MSEDKLREQFEAWFNKNHWNPLADPEDGEGNCDGFLNSYDKESNEYQEDHTNEMWFAWQACAKIKDAEIEELLDAYQLDYAGQMYEMEELNAD